MCLCEKCPESLLLAIIRSLAVHFPRKTIPSCSYPGAVVLVWVLWSISNEYSLIIACFTPAIALFTAQAS